MRWHTDTLQLYSPMMIKIEQLFAIITPHIANPGLSFVNGLKMRCLTYGAPF